ncbi:type II toxin-antitoxin system RelE/ParE family toxin [Novosphingobium mangrovi (ex Huang et al. 2023)]|uniref:Type II toxin-antitoxin system RelE/ParE family toxin n=1 Tax=Novosphingobium mangrovi (ex Huang et al. 2023) TaxID=2976432 RepID=A0ABT2I418_9SPHN|nr:type II toxin-antitoxin system RelE/ParE family toxin [Novosphingobium mangrovi (ex Huang et al. 2023)]MCT2399327.1 type II toxin-antitoxin system RelE/ParE family toxin [Novosphingobium mangrovi (ex Huang et al. 2023)]
MQHRLPDNLKQRPATLNIIRQCRTNPNMQTVIETESYLRAVKDAGMAEEERQAAVDLVASDPEGGDVMQGTGGVRKARLAGRGKGKSGGYRIVWYFGGGDIPVFLLTVFGKGEKANLTQGERNALRSLTAKLRESLGAD